jgi:single-strand DNA-binding protein
MPANFNQVNLVGNLTRDIELRRIASGIAVTDMAMAVNDRVKRGDEWVDETTYVDVTLWGKTAEVADKYLSKGSSVLISGRLKLDKWEDRETGNERTKLKVVADKLQLLGGNAEKVLRKLDPEPKQNPRPKSQGFDVRLDLDGEEPPF